MSKRSAAKSVAVVCKRLFNSRLPILGAFSLENMELTVNRTITMLVTIACLGMMAPLAHGKDVKVRGYYNSHGTYVAPHYRTASDGKRNNNYSTKGNYNYHTGKVGTHRRTGHRKGAGQ